MRLLADTHVLIWALLDPTRLSADAAAAMRDGEHEVFCSAASAWEVAIKVGIGKLDLGTTVEAFMAHHLQNEMRLLPIRIAHSARVAGLPRHHGDPFDRMLIAQAMQEDLEIITADPAFSRYEIGTVW